MSRRAIQEQIGVALRAGRWARGITQGELSRLLGIDRSTLARYEAGDRPIPATVLIECAMHLQISLDALFDLKKTSSRPSAAGQAAELADVDIVKKALCQYPHLATMIRKWLETMPETGTSVP